MTEISFTSRIVPVTTSRFGQIISAIGSSKHADYPWTIATSVIGQDVYTRGIIDCTSCLITDGQEAVLMHLSCDLLRGNFNAIREFLRSKFWLNRPNLQALVVGSKNYKNSSELFNNFISLMKEAKIPTSILKDSYFPVDIAYKSGTDEIYVSSFGITEDLMDRKLHSDIINSAFEKVEISPLDEIA